MNYDVVVIGAGPVGIATACSIKAVNNSIQICVLDKLARRERHHEVLVKADTIEKIQYVLSEAQKNYFSANDNVDRLMGVIRNWKDRVIPISKIEADLAGEARRMGVKVLRGKEYEVGEALLDSEGLERIFSAAKVIIGADGPDSVVRRVVMPVDVKKGHAVALSYKTEGGASHILQVSVKKETFDALCLKNSWTLEELRAEEEQNIKEIYQRLQAYTNGMKARMIQCLEEKVSTLEMSIFRSEPCAMFYRGKWVLLVGDAESRAALGNGFSKGLRGAAACANTVTTFFSPNYVDETLFKEHKQIMKRIFEES